MSSIAFNGTFSCKYLLYNSIPVISEYVISVFFTKGDLTERKQTLQQTPKSKKTSLRYKQLRHLSPLPLKTDSQLFMQPDTLGCEIGFKKILKITINIRSEAFRCLGTYLQRILRRI